MQSIRKCFIVNGSDPDQTSQNVASDQSMFALNTGMSLKHGSSKN